MKLTFKTPQSPEATAYASLLRAGGTQQVSGRRVSTAQTGSANFSSGCDCNNLYCICTYQHG